MAVEPISGKQQADAADALADCRAGAAQAAEQAAADAARKAADAVRQAGQALAKIPDEITDAMQEAIKTLLKVINGWEDPSAPEFDPDAVIKKLEALLSPVVNSLCAIVDSVGLPEIPGLKQISDLLAALLRMRPPERPEGWQGEWPRPGKRPEIPQEMKRLLQELYAAVLSLSVTLPMVCVNILFNTVDLILKTSIPVVGLSFYSIIGMVPFVREIPQLVALAPKITKLVTNLPGELGNIAEGKIKQMVKAAQDLSVPEAPEEVPVPKDLPACPQRG